MRGFIQELVKAELHVHLEGSIEPATLAELDPSLTSEAIAELYGYSSFPGFLSSYEKVVRRLRTPEDFALITRRLLARLDAENVRYAEINLSVGVMIWRKQDVAPIFDAVNAEARRSPVEVRWIFDAVRQFAVADAMRVAELAAERTNEGVVAFGLGGDEARGPVERFAETLAWARGHGLHLAPHAGESTGAETIWASLRLGAERIGHGIRAVDDAALMHHLRDHDVPLEISISSNVATGVVESLDAHPVRRLFDSGVPIVLNSDDPAMFHTTLEREYELAASHFGFSEQELALLARNSFRYAFTDAGRRLALRRGTD
jgi:adenosine deaminase/aminodeoxyfutalosine deaminase